MKRFHLTAATWFLPCLALGIALALLAGQTVDLEFGTKTALDEGVTEDTIARTAQLAQNDDNVRIKVGCIVLPAGLETNSLLLAAATVLADSLEDGSGSRPAVATSEATKGPRDEALDIVAVVDPTGSLGEDGYVLSIETRSRWMIRASDYRGAAAGLFRVADAIRSDWGKARLETLFDAKETIPVCALRLVDLGGVGIDPDPTAWLRHDYSHNNLVFPRLALSEPPYVDPQALDAYLTQLKTYLTRMASYGYNGVVFEGFLQFIDFDEVGDGFEIYPADSVYRARHEKIRRAYERLFLCAKSLGFKIYLYTDMPSLSVPLKKYLDEQLGGIDPEDARLWNVYKLGLDELFRGFPMLDGLMVRVGEGGSVYNRPDGDYWSVLATRSAAAVRTMLRSFSEVAGNSGRTIIFRSWSVGLGEVGNMHSDPTTYLKVLGNLSSPDVLVSTKFVQGDFESYLPLNPTLAVGTQPRLIEFEARREYEGFSTYPNYLAPAHQRALQAALAEGARIEGVWVWAQMGGPVRAGPMSLYPFVGPFDAIDANVYATARLAWDPQSDLAQITLDWVSRTYGPRDSGAAAALAEITLLSHDVAKKGIYLGDFSKRLVITGGRDAEAVGRLFQWDILSGSASELGLAYRVLSSDLEPVIEEGWSAVGQVRSLLEQASLIDLSRVAHPSRLVALRESLHYELSTFEILAAYRELSLVYQRWLDKGDPADLARWRRVMSTYEQTRARHLAQYGASVSYPALNFVAADQWLTHARRATIMTWTARGWLALVGVLLVAAPWSATSRRGGGLKSVVITDLVLASTSFVATVAAVGILSSFIAPTLLLLAFLGLVAVWTSAIAYGLRSRRAVLAALAGPQLLGAGLLLVPVAVRSPMYLWQNLLFDDAFRTVLVALAVVTLLLGPFALYFADRIARRRTAALAHVLVTWGAGVATVGSLVLTIGVETVVSRVNDELGILPYALGRTLGLTTYMDLTYGPIAWVTGAAAGLVFLLSAVSYTRRGTV